MRHQLESRVMGIRHALRRALIALIGDGWKQTILRLALVGCLAGIVGFSVAWLGLVPIAASDGHWPATRWFLHFTMRKSVRTHALGTDVPKLEDKALALKGAGHYATGCAACHGSPGERPSLVTQHMTPKPPYLPPKIQEWSSEQLFWIVKHGIKYTAMPAWPSLKRDDEVWAMVTFLQQLPDLTPEAYRELAFGPSDDLANPNHLQQLSDPLGPVLENCARCHGKQGMGRGTGAFPVLAGQSEEYLFASMQAYASGERYSGIMQPIAAGLDEEMHRALARYYATLEVPATSRGAREEPDAIGRGKHIAEHGVKEVGVPECTSCHGPGTSERNPIYPSLAGQYSDYLMLQLSLFKTGSRGGTPYAHIMQQVATQLTKDQMRDIALFYASLPPAGVSDQPQQ